MASTPTGQGYWLVASDGGIFAFGDARFFGSTGAIALARPITGMATSPSGGGYWLTASDGGVFAFGDAAFKGAAPDRPARADRQIVAMVPSGAGGGYWQASASGELLAFGDAPYFGGAESPSRPIVGMAAVPARGSTDIVVPGTIDTPTTTTTAPAPFMGTPTIFSSTATTRVYLVGHYDHYVPDPQDPCLQLTLQPNGQMGINCPAGSPNRHLAAFYAQGGVDANGKPTGIAQVDPTFTAQSDTPEGPSTALIGAHYLYIAGNFQLTSDTPGANFRRQPGFAEFPAIG